MATDLPQGFVRDKPEKAPSAGLPAGFVPDNGGGGGGDQFGDVDLMTQTLYDMAKTPTERKRALEHGYGSDSVKEDAKGLYIEKDGKRLKPAQSAFHSAKAMTARIATEAAPTLGAVGGGILGARGGAKGAIGGAALGGALGQSFNDTMLSLAGINDRSIGGNLKTAGETGAFSALGEGAGRVVGRGIAAATKEGGTVRKLARWALGVDETELARAKELADQNINVPPESYAKEAPILPVVRAWAKRFGYDPVAKTAKPYYENSAKQVLQTLGVPEHETGSLTDPKAAVSYESTGEALIKKAQQKLAEDDAKLDAAVASMRSSMDRKMTAASEAHTTQIADLTKASDEARASAEKLIDHGWDQIDATQRNMWDAAKLGEEPGNLARKYASQVLSLRKSVMRRARTMYDSADAMSGSQVINVGKLKGSAEQLVSQMPEDLQRYFPGMARTLAEMESTGLTFGAARNLRSQLREMTNYDDLTSGFKNGILKKFSGELNAAIHAPGNSPKIKEAVAELDKADAFYAKEMARFKDQEVRSLTKQVKAGLPPDPVVIAQKVLKGGYAERAGELKKIVGPDVWKATVAADINGMLRESQSLVPGLVDTKAFAGEVLKRVKSGVLDHYPPEVKQMLMDHARKLEALDGRIDVAKLPEDDFKTFLQRSNDMVKRIEEMSKINPVETLQSELKMAEKDFKASRDQVDQQRAGDQLAFLTKPTALASESAKRIIKNPDLLRAALLRFDADGPEIQMLRQTAARDMLTMGIEHGGNLMDRLTAEGMTPEVQKRLFPNGLDQDVLKLAENMQMLFPAGSDVYAALSGGALVTNPGRLAPRAVRGLLHGVPNALIRTATGKALSAAANIMTSPQLVKYLSKGISEGPEEREAVRQAILSVVETGGDVGAVLGAWTGQGVTGTHDPVGANPQGGETWRDRYQQKYAARSR